ncbi:MAG: hypothetical protein ABI634_08570 [Acidobacteriota bacterium]
MPDIHVPELDDHDEPEPAAVAPSRRPRGRSLPKIVLEVVLISLGVFLGLAGEQWRQASEHRELAQEALRRFRTEFQTNQKAVDGVVEKHRQRFEALSRYLRSHNAQLAARMKDPSLPIPDEGALADLSTDPAFFEYSAWDVALATQSLAYIDQDLAVAIAHVYRVQRQIDEATTGITHAMYAYPGDVLFLRGLSNYYGDCALLEPRLQKIYEEMIPRLDRAVGDAGAAK